MTDPTPPAWVDEWSAPFSDKDWGFEKRHDVWLLAHLMTSHPKILKSKTGVAGVKTVMDSIVLLGTPTKLKRALSRYPRPVEKVPAPKRVSTQKPIFLPPPAFQPVRVPIARSWADAALSLYPDHDRAEMLRKYMDIMEAKTALGVTPTAAWSSYWTSMRAMVITAFVEMESYDLGPEHKIIVGSKPDVFSRVRAARELGYQVATINDGADSGAAPDEDVLPHGDTGRRDRSAAGGAAVPTADDGVPEDLGADDLDRDWGPLEPDEEGSD